LAALEAPSTGRDLDDLGAKVTGKAVSYLVQPLLSLLPVIDFSLAAMMPNSLIVLRKMIFYKYIPGNAKELESSRTEPMKRHIKPADVVLKMLRTYLVVDLVVSELFIVGEWPRWQMTTMCESSRIVDFSLKWKIMIKIWY
jgi:hypothetical protein